MEGIAMFDKILTALIMWWLLCSTLSFIVGDIWLLENTLPAEYISVKFRLGLLFLVISGAALSRIIADIVKIKR